MELAELFPNLDTLRWACSFAGELFTSCAQQHRSLTLLIASCNSSASGTSATFGVKGRSSKELHLLHVAR